MKNLFFVIAILAIVACIPAMSFAQEGGKGKGPGGGRGFGPMFINDTMLLGLFDADKDGKIAKKEWDEVFKKIDGDGDGTLSTEELTKYQEKAREEAVAAWFKTLDKNGDGSIAKDEYQGRAERFNQLDSNGDGKVSLDEFKAQSMRFGGPREGDKGKEPPKEDKPKEEGSDKE